MTIGRWIREMDVIPPHYGIAYLDPVSMRAFCLPVPLNKFVGAFRAWWLEWRRPVEDDPIVKAYYAGWTARDQQPLSQREFQAALDVLKQRLDNEIAQKWRK